MSSIKHVDLKCSETLRDSPPPPSLPQPQIPVSPYNTSVFASTVITAPNTPSHHQIQSHGNSLMATALNPQQQAATVSLLVRKFDPQRGVIERNSPIGRIPSTDSPSGSNGGKIISTNSSSSSSLPFGIANVVSTAKTSSQFHQSQSTNAQQQPHVFTGFPLSSGPSAATLWPLSQHHTATTIHQSPGSSKQSIFQSTASNVVSSPTRSQTGASSATLPLSLSPTKAYSSVGGGPAQIRPLTLHVVSTSRGPAVLQIQQPPATTSSGKQPVKILSGGGNAMASQVPQTTAIGATGTSRSITTLPPSAVGATIPTRVPILRPSPLHPMAAATAALLTQLAPNAPGFGLVDHHQHLQAAAALLRSPMANTVGGGGAVLPHVVAVTQQASQQGNATSGERTVIVGPNSHDVTSSTSAVTTKTSSGILAASSATAGTISGSATPSPTRPSILRKRAHDLLNGGGSGSPKRLGYEPVVLARKVSEKESSTPDSEVRPTATSTQIEPAEAGNSNHSSSASTISVSSVADNGNGHSLNSSQSTITGYASPSPRKRQRKQQLNELTSSRGYCSDDDLATPVMGYHSETVEEETVMGPTGIGGLDNRYLSSSSPPVSQRGQGLLLPLTTGDYLDQYSGHKRKFGSTSSNSSASQRQSHFDRPSTSFDQLQQQIEQQRKHVPEYRPRPSLLAQYELAYDSKRFHFALYDDLKAKDEKRQSIVELSNQKQIWQRIAGWKVHLMAVQLDSLDQDEQSNLDDLNDLYGVLNAWTFDEDDEMEDDSLAEERKELGNLKEMVLTNMQRVRAIREHLDDGKKQLLSIFKHKANVEKLISKYTSKRPIRKKDRCRNGGTTSEL